MSLKSFYIAKMMNIPARFGLSQNAQRLLRDLDSYHMGHISEGEMGKIVRLSVNNRKAITETIARCAGIMEKKPDDLKFCVSIIQSCTEILSIADKPLPLEAFNFLQLPREIRGMIYRKVLCLSPNSTVSQPKKTSCNCLNEGAFAYTSKVSMAIAFTSKRIFEEVTSLFYYRQTFNFACCCDLLHQLQGNALLAEKLRRVRVHWSGDTSAAAFVQLEKCRNLESLTIAISKMTTFNLNEREVTMRKYFMGLRSPRLVDSLGMDELLEIRGLLEVKVQHVSTKSASRRSEEERCSMQGLLQAKLLGPREEEPQPGDSA